MIVSWFVCLVSVTVSVGLILNGWSKCCVDFTTLMQIVNYLLCFFNMPLDGFIRHQIFPPVYDRVSARFVSLTPLNDFSVIVPYSLMEISTSRSGTAEEQAMPGVYVLL